MKNKLLLLVILFSTIFAIESTAQQDAQYTQYMYNTLSVNPAYAGSRDVLSMTGLYRTQWVGLPGAPKTVTVAGHAPLGNNLGIGFSIIHDEIGPVKENNLYADITNMKLSKIIEKNNKSFVICCIMFMNGRCTEYQKQSTLHVFMII